MKTLWRPVLPDSMGTQCSLGNGHARVSIPGAPDLFSNRSPRADRRFWISQADNGREPRTGPTGENSVLRSVDGGMYAALPTFDLNNRRTTKKEEAEYTV